MTARKSYQGLPNVAVIHKMILFIYLFQHTSPGKQYNKETYSITERTEILPRRSPILPQDNLPIGGESPERAKQR